MTASILWTAKDAVAATGGRTGAAWNASGVSIDTRTLRPGDLFIAIKGPNFDGHAFASKALASGAAAVVVEHLPEGAPEDGPMLIVEDTLTALQDLGVAARQRTRASVIAVTGSVGKTGTKDMLKHVLSSQGNVSASEGNLNNHWGLPLSLARMPREADYGIFEMGMNHPGEIRPLSRMARPRVAVITTVEPVHSAYFNSVEEIADAKAEIFAGMDSGGVAVLNRDNDYFDRLAAAAADQGVGTLLAFGTHESADVRLTGLVQGEEGSRVQANVAGTMLDYTIGVSGRHLAMNSLAVLAAVHAVGGDVRKAAAALATLMAPAGRGRRHQVRLKNGFFNVIDESYNASPVSMNAAIETLGKANPGTAGRRIAALGDMLELGEKEKSLHAALSGPLQRNGIDLVFTAGSRMAALWQALPSSMKGAHAGNSEELAPKVTQSIGAGDIITVKGSAGSNMGVVVRALLDMEGRHTAPSQTVNGG
ncbi:MAG: UDP-N-acetylmuramoylalanyl-D-glutamyl-2,6-diaminopimelate--D-alanyl-D-alanine ligase [Rhodospirillales bacterium]|nr:UDP-N-acetylmuramoylalanyl-D-glutamyl-2,6-diaminopimelate--D-alanyl-D-alanine ligase [Rhodospirillales bacterium]